MRALIVILGGMFLVHLTTAPSLWRSVRRAGDRIESIQSPFTTRLWARQLEMDEARVRAIYAAFVRCVWFAFGVAMVVGGVVFLVQHGWAWDL